MCCIESLTRIGMGVKLLRSEYARNEYTKPVDSASSLTGIPGREIVFLARHYGNKDPISTDGKGWFGHKTAQSRQAEGYSQGQAKRGM
jgi:hypothetical protein